MSYYLAIWKSPKAISDDEAASAYRVLSQERPGRTKFDFQVYAFYSLLTGLYPEIDMTSDGGLDACPWDCAIDMPGSHVILAIRLEKLGDVLPTILALAGQHDLVCFDPQSGKVHLPPYLRPRQSGVS